MVYGRNRSGKTSRAGGHGPIVSDEGSGSWIGREAVAEALRLCDAGIASPLLDTLQRSWRVKDITGLVSHVNQMTPADFAAIFPLVDALAAKGAPACVTVLQSAGAVLAEMVSCVQDKLFPDGDYTVRFSGGVIRSSTAIQTHLRDTLGIICPRATLDSAEVDPVLGALYMARSAPSNAHAPSK